MSFIPKVAPETGKAWLPLQAADLVVYEFRLLYDKVAQHWVPKPGWRGWRASLVALHRTLPLDEHIVGTDYYDALHASGILPAREEDMTQKEQRREPQSHGSGRS